MKHVLVMLSLIGLSLLNGCASGDPWGVFERVSPSPSEPFRGEISADDELEQTGAVPDVSGRTLSLPECVSLALEHNPQTSVAWQAARVAAARVGRARAEYLPTAGLSAGAARGDAAELDEQADRGAQDRYEGVVGARWLLFDGGGREARAAGAEAELLAANFRQSSVLQNVALTVQKSYYRLLAARSFEEVAMETVRQRDYQLELAQARHEVGVAAKSDVLKAETEKADADLARVRAQNAVHVARGQLARAMGVGVNTEFQIMDVLDDSFGRAPGEVDALMAEAARNRPELKSALAEVHAERADVAEARSRYWPALGVDTSLGWLGRHLLPDQRQWSFGVVADLPLFTGFDRPYHLQGAEADVARAVAACEDALQGIELEVWTAYWGVTEASEAIQAARRLLASAEESARVAEGEYKNGTGTIVDLIVAQTASTAARNSLVQARLDWHVALARLDRAVGRSLAESRTDSEEQRELQ